MAKLTEAKLQHIINVARLCYEIAKNKYHKSESFCRKMWMIGYCHDAGYEFIDNLNPDTYEHPQIANDMIWDAFKGDCKAIFDHGKKLPQNYIELRILNEADLRINSKGNIISVENRIEEQKQKYGENSKEYLNSLWLAQELNLI